MRRHLALALSLLSCAAFGADKTYVLKAARMFDGNKMSTPGVVVVHGRLIGAVGATAKLPPEAEIIDFGDATLLPGFIDAHTHMSEQLSADYRQTMLDNLQKTTAEKALNASANARKTIMAGFTTTRDVGGSEFIDVGLRNAINAGIIPGPRMLVAVHAIGSTGGHCDNQEGFRFGLFGYESGPADGVINGPEEARKAVRLNIKYGADVIKACATGGVLSLTDDVDSPQLTQEELNALVDEAHALRRKTAAHAHGATGAKRAIRAGIDSIEHGSFLDEEALDLMKAKGTVLIPTMMTASYGKEQVERGAYPPKVTQKMMAAMESLTHTVTKAYSKGVIIGLGTDAAVYPHGRNAGEFALMVAAGVKPLDALRAGTSIDAKLLGIADRLGTLEPGKLADVVAIPGDPMSDMHGTEKVMFVMKEGFAVRNDKQGGLPAVTGSAH